MWEDASADGCDRASIKRSRLDDRTGDRLDKCQRVLEPITKPIDDETPTVEQRFVRSQDFRSRDMPFSFVFLVFFHGES